MVKSFETIVKRRRARLLLSVSAALLLFDPGSRGWAEDEPAARAPLPPLPTKPVEVQLPQKPFEIPGPGLTPARGNQATATPLAHAHRSEVHSLPSRSRSIGAAPHGIAAPTKLTLPSHSHMAKKAPRSFPHGTLAFTKPQRSRSPTRPGAGHLSPPPDEASPPMESAAVELAKRPEAFIPFYPYPPARPAFGFGSDYPYPWPPPNPGFYR